ncbi:MAG: repeat protein [Acidobacteriales bacterium]|nr:repeat protein [Terriglobales bacterium]
MSGRKLQSARVLAIACWLVFCAAGNCLGQTAPPAIPAAKTAKTDESQATSKADIKKSEKLFSRALRLHSDENKIEESFAAFEESAALNPTEVTYATTREFVRQELVSQHLKRGNALLEQNRQVEASAEFRQALALDPSNAFAEQRLQDTWGAAPQRTAAQSVEFAGEPELAPKPGAQSFTFRGDTRQLMQNIGRAFGIDVIFDESFTTRQTRFNVPDVDFTHALQIARQVTHSFILPVTPTQMLVAADTQDVRRRLERMSLKTFYIPTAGSPQDFQEIVQVLRAMLDIRFITANPSAATVTIRAPGEVLRAAGQIIDNLSEGRPQVLLEIRALQVSESMSRNIGVNLPLSFTIFNLNTELRALGPNAQDLINRFNAGTLTPADLAAAQAALAASQNSPLTKGFATFGGGTTKFGVVIPASSVQLGYDKSATTSLQHMTLRAEQGHAATFRVGDRFPVITGTFSSALSGIQLPAGIPQSALQPITPSFNYEDLGITLKATPSLTGESDVTMQLELQIKALGALQFNAIPVISNREFKGTITLRDGQTSVMAGSIDQSETKSLSGMPWLSRVPGLRHAVSSTSKQTSTSQLLLLVTPHILRAKRDKDQKTESYLGSGN